MRIRDLFEAKSSKKQEIPAPRNFVAKHAVQSGSGAHKNKKKAAKQGDVRHKSKVHEDKLNKPDVIKMDVPLLLRVLEYAKEDAKTDMDLHFVAKNLIDLSQEDRTLSMTDYNKIVSTSQVEESATAGATSAGNIASGPIYKNNLGKTAKNKNGTAKNALDMKNTNLLTGGSIKR